MQQAIDRFLNYLRVERNASDLTLKSYREDFPDAKFLCLSQVDHPQKLDNILVVAWEDGVEQIVNGIQ